MVTGLLLCRINDIAGSGDASCRARTLPKIRSFAHSDAHSHGQFNRHGKDAHLEPPRCLRPIPNPFTSHPRVRSTSPAASVQPQTPQTLFALYGASRIFMTNATGADAHFAIVASHASKGLANGVWLLEVESAGSGAMAKLNFSLNFVCVRGDL